MFHLGLGLSPYINIPIVFQKALNLMLLEKETGWNNDVTGTAECYYHLTLVEGQGFESTLRPVL